MASTTSATASGCVAARCRPSEGAIPLARNTFSHAKDHVRLDLQTLQRRCVVIDSAREHDDKRAAELTAVLRPGEIVIADRGYVDQRHLGELDARGVFWVTREKDNMVWDLVEERPMPEKEGVLKGQVLPTIQALHGQQSGNRR